MLQAAIPENTNYANRQRPEDRSRRRRLRNRRYRIAAENGPVMRTWATFDQLDRNLTGTVCEGHIRRIDRVRQALVQAHKGLSTAVGFFRTNAAVTGAATSMQRTFEVAPFRRPVIASDIEPDTSGQTKTLPSITGTEEMAISIAAESTDVLYCDPDRCPRYGQNRFSCCPSPNHLFDIHYPDLPVCHAQTTSSVLRPAYPLLCPY